ncbi:gamma-glutamyl-gamma-aminobutyrate hydrolase family protein [Streptomyces sp. NPDC005336]|uniref:gamma-glutamyl-gamma-aminobutyrate hydrolase family protein n=1 Tax=unclassified Streptomyces TaxID=2593676 RepID=UPI0033B5A839
MIAVTYSSSDLRDAVQWKLMFRGIVAAGAVPLAIDCGLPQPRISELVRITDGLLVYGGGDVSPALYGGDPDDPLLARVSPCRDRNELTALGTARDLGRPTLAICRGMQLLNVAYGGELHGDLGRDRPGEVRHRQGVQALVHTLHTVAVEPTSRIAEWMGASGRVEVNSEHHQGIRVVGKGLRATAHAADGLVEAVESDDARAVGVQWHPEFIWPSEAHAMNFLSGFVRECQGALTGAGVE